MRKSPVVIRQTDPRTFVVDIAPEFTEAEAVREIMRAAGYQQGIRSGTTGLGSAGFRSCTMLTREHDSAFERREAIPRPASFDDEANTVEAVIASATPVRRRDARGEYLEILDPAGLDVAGSRGASVLDSHQTAGLDAVLGTLDDLHVAGAEVVGTIRFSGRPEIMPLIADVRSGIVRHLSVGYEVLEWRDGTDGKGQRTRTAVKWIIREASFVSVPADRTARTRGLGRGADRASTNRSIRELGRRASTPQSVIDDIIDRGLNLTDARSEIAFAMIERQGSPIRAVVGRDYTDPDVQNRTMGDALYAKLTGAAPQGAARELAHRSMIELMEHHARSNGIRLRSTNPADVYAAVMQTRADAGGMMTTSDFPLLLGDTMNRRLGELFRAAESGASAIAAPGTARDFRPITEGKLTSFPSLEPLTESGELSWGQLDETGEVLAIASFARAIGVSFPTMVNDNLGAVDRSLRDVGFASATLKAALILAAFDAVMSDGLPLFDLGHANLNEAATGEDDGLSKGRLAMAKQTPPGSTEPLGLQPSIILCPSELQTEAERAVALIQPTRADDANPFSGKLSVAPEPRLTDSYAWYLFAAPTVYPVVRFLTLAGFELPRFEVSQEFNRLGTSYRVHWHVGAGPVDHRGAWKTTGGDFTRATVNTAS